MQVRTATSKAPDQILADLHNTFTYDWTDFKTIEHNANQIACIENQISLITDSQALSENAKHHLSKLSYRIGTYYLYAELNPSLASKHLELAKPFLAEHCQDWLSSHIALCQYYLGNLDVALSECQTLISQHHDAERCDADRISLLAFSLWVRSLIEFKQKKFKSAAISSKSAIDLFRNIKRKDDPYAFFKLSHAIARNA